MMRALDLFSAAAGGWSLGLHRAGFVTIAACEIVEWRRILYAENNPHVRLYEDVRGLTAARLVSDLGILPDIIVGSPPCQDISSANTKGKGIDGERSGLYLEAVRLVGDCRPRWFAFENSPNLRTRGADRLLDELETLGYPATPGQRQTVPAAPIIPAEAARNYRYGLQVQGDSPPWRPVSVFDDGRRVYVVFPAGIVQGEMPPIFVLGANGEPQIVNSRVHQNVLIVDRLFGAAELRLGSGNRQQVVRIVRTNPTQAADAQPASATGGSPS